jgi:hypothetical protein
MIRASLCAIMDEWTSARDHATCVASLNGTGTGTRENGTTCLKKTGTNATVFDDLFYDVMTGSAGMDWFFADQEGAVVDRITDLSAAEFANDLEFIGS